MMLELFLFFNILTLKLIQKCYVMHAKNATAWCRNLLPTSKSGQHLISPYNITIESESQE